MTTGPTRSSPGRLRPKEVCSQLGIQPYVLKFWENEFPQLGKRVGSKRLYGDEELAILAEIQRLVDAERLNLAQARDVLEHLFPEGGEKRARGRGPRKKRSGETSSQAENVLGEARKELKAFEERVDRLNGELAVKSAEIQQLRERFDNLTESEGTLREERDCLLAREQELEQRLERVDAELRQARQQHQAFRRQMGVELSDALEAVRELNEALDELDPDSQTE